MINIADNIIPVPQKVSCIAAEPVVFGICGEAKYTVCADIPGDLALAQNACKRLCNQLEALLGTAPCEAVDAVQIVLKLDTPPADMPNGDQGYQLCAREREVILTGYGELGLFYAATTLLQCLQPENGLFCLPAMEVLDYPTLKTRGHFLETRYGTDLMELEDWKQVVDENGPTQGKSADGVGIWLLAGAV